MKLDQLSNLITVRDFAVKIFDNVYVKMSTEQVRQLRAKIAVMDQTILDGMLKLDPTVVSTAEVLQERPKKKNETAKQLEQLT